MNLSMSIEHHPLTGNRKYRHTPWLASTLAGIPQSYIWLWISEGLLKTQKYVGKLYVHLGDVLQLRDQRVFEAATTTGEPIPEPLASKIQKMYQALPDRPLAESEEG